MAISTFRVLVVDDYEPWRNFVSTTLRQIAGLRVVGEALDGSEAIHKAQELQPDLILLDIGLPHLNGLEAARRIRTLSPASKILFVTQELSADLAQEALNIGALGYVVKADAGRELISAITAVLRGEQFLGSRFVEHDFTRSSSLRIPDARLQNECPASGPVSIGKAEIAYRHEVHFHSNDDSLLDGLTQCVRTALSSGSAIIVFASESHRTHLVSGLQAHGIDMTAAVGQRRYHPLDPVEFLSKLMVGDMPDPTRLFNVLNHVIQTVSSHSGAAQTRTVVCGGLAPILLAQGKPEAAIRLEQLWNEVVTNYGLETICMYSKESFEIEQDSNVFQRICELHSSVHSR